MSQPEISIIVPIKNEELNIGPQIAEIREAMLPLGKDFEIIYVDDGSTDASWRVLQEALPQCPELRILRFDRNHGQSAATEAGIRAARGRILATLDGDMQNVPADLPGLLPLLEQADMVCGWRAGRKDTAWRLLQSRFANWLRNSLTGETIRDTGCSLKVFRRECFANIRFFNGMHRFMPTMARLDGFRIAEAPVSHRPRERGQAKYGFRNRVLRSALDLLAVRWMQRRWVRYRVIEDVSSPASKS